MEVHLYIGRHHQRRPRFCRCTPGKSYHLHDRFLKGKKQNNISVFIKTASFQFSLVLIASVHTVLTVVNGNHEKITYSFGKSFSAWPLHDLTRFLNFWIWKTGQFCKFFPSKIVPILMSYIQNYILSYLTTKFLINLLFLKIPVTLNEILL